MLLNGHILANIANEPCNSLVFSALLSPNSVTDVYGITVAQTDTAHSATWCGVCRFRCAINLFIHL